MPPSSEVPAGPYPFIVKSNHGRDVPVVQAYAFGKYLGHLKVTFDDAGNVIIAVGNPILMDSSIPQGRLKYQITLYTCYCLKSRNHSLNQIRFYHVKISQCSWKCIKDLGNEAKVLSLWTQKKLDIIRSGNETKLLWKREKTFFKSWVSSLVSIPAPDAEHEL